VIDTNVIAAALMTNDASSATAQVLHLARSGAVRALLSSDLVGEYREVLMRRRLVRRHKRSKEEINALLGELAEHSVLVEPPDSPAEGPDPDDAHLWRLLSTDTSAILITGDHALQRGRPMWARVMSPREWIDSVSLE
jgi:uncharacterized protein